MAKKTNIFREILTGSGNKLSSKRVFGGLSMLTALGCTLYLVLNEGGTDTVENLLMTIFISSISLLGLPSVTGIWKDTKINTNVKEEKEDEE